VGLDGARGGVSRQPGQPNACNLPLNTLPGRPVVRGPGLRLLLSLSSALVNQFGTPAQWDRVPGDGCSGCGCGSRWAEQPFYGP